MKSSLLAALVAGALLALALAVFWNRGTGPAPAPAAAAAAADRASLPPATVETAADADGDGGPVGPDARRTAVAATSGPAAAPTDEDGPRVTGRVVDPDGDPVADARVFFEQTAPAAGVIRLHGLDGLQRRLRDGVRTDADGRFSLPRKQPGTATLVAAHADWRDGRTETAVPAANVEIRLAAGATIAGQVRNLPAATDHDGLRVACRRIASDDGERGNGNPLAGMFRIDVGAMAGGLGAARGERDAPVDADGAFELRGLDSEGEYEVWAFLPADLDGDGTLDPIDARVCTDRVRVLVGARGVGLNWREALLLRLTVVAPDGVPLETLRVAAGLQREMELFGQKMTATDSRVLQRSAFPGGRVEIDSLQVDGESGVASVEVEAEGFRPWSRREIPVPRTGVVDLGRIELEPASGVAVTVLDAARGTPIAGATVRAYPAPDDPRPQRGSSSVRINRDDGDQPAVNGAAVATDGDGRAMLRCTATARAVVAVRAEGRAPSWTQIALPTSGVVDHTVVLGVGGTVVVTVADATGAPVADRVVEHRDDTPHRELRQADPEGRDAETRTDADGVATFRHLPPGDHAFRAAAVERGTDDDGGESRFVFQVGEDKSWTKASVVEGGETDVRLELPATGTLRGVVTLDGAPLAAAKVRLERRGVSDARSAVVMLFGGQVGDGAAVRANTGADGRFELTDVEHGTYRAVVRHADLAMAAERDVEVVGAEQTVDIALRDTVLTGRVVDDRGQPIPAARIRIDRDGGSGATLGIQLSGAARLGGGAGRGSSPVEPDGTFELHGVIADQELTVRADHPGRLGARLRIDPLRTGERRALGDLVLLPAGALELHCGIEGAQRVTLVRLDDTGEPIEGSELRRRLRSGATRFDELAPGLYRATVAGASGAIGPARTVAVPAGAAQRLDW